MIFTLSTPVVDVKSTWTYAHNISVEYCVSQQKYPLVTSPVWEIIRVTGCM